MVEVSWETGLETAFADSTSNSDFGPDANDEASFEVIDHSYAPFSLIPSENAGASCPEQSLPSAPNQLNDKDKPYVPFETISMNPTDIESLISYTSKCSSPNQSVAQSVTPSSSFIKDAAGTSAFTPSPLCSDESQSDIQSRLDQLLQENVYLKDTLQQNNLALKQHSAELLHWREEVAKVHQHHKEKFQETRNLVHKLREQNASMHKTIEEQSAQIKKHKVEVVQGPSQNEISLTNMVQQLTAQLQVADLALKEKVESAKATEEQLLALREENKLLKKNVEDLNSLERHNNDYHEARSQGFSLRLDELTAKLLSAEQQLEQKRQEVKALLEQLGDGDSHSHEEAVKRLRKRIDDMTGLIVERDQQLEAKSQEINLKSEIISRLEKEIEAIPILKAQVDVYRSDFNAEREARERVVGEKEQLAEDLRKLHRRNEELLRERRGSATGRDEEEENLNSREHSPLEESKFFKA